MKKWIAVSVIISLALALCACGSAQNSNLATTASTKLSLEGQLLVGSLKLENTSLALSADQADQLLPLWEALESLASSNAAASQEIEAVVSQIESSMSPQQVSSITTMKLTQQDLEAAILNAGVTTLASNSTNASSSQAQTGQGAPAPGSPDGGNPPGGPGNELSNLTGAQTTGQTQTGSLQAVTGQTAVTTNQVSARLIDTLIELLKKKIG